MHISALKIKGFRSFGSEITISVREKLTTFIGLNSSGKTAALDSLRKLFGHSVADREILREDFHIAYNEDTKVTQEKELFLEVRIHFDDYDSDAISQFFSEMVVDGSESDPYIRIRLEAVWKPSELYQEGDIESKLYFITVPERSTESEDSKRTFPNHLKSLIQIIYVPAIRKPSDQIKYASGSMLYRVLRKVKWDQDFKTKFEQEIEIINKLFKDLEAFNTIQDSITDFWGMFHRDKRYQLSELGFGKSDFQSILKKIDVSFSPTGTHRTFSVDELGEGYRSLFYLTLVCALLEVEEKLSEGSDEIGLSRPLLTLLAIEEPENHIAPQLLGRVTTILKTISERGNAQIFLSSHTPAIVKRISPESLCHFRIDKELQTDVNHIVLPEKSDEAYKFVKEAIHNYPEIYFAKLVVIGEGDSEEVIFNKLMDVKDIDFDDNVVTFAPLGHRFVNHIWKLLSTLHIPYVTLLDLDLEREGGGYGRIKYAITQLLEIGVKREKLLMTTTGILSEEKFKKMHSWKTTSATMEGWISMLKKYDVFFSYPLDIDFLMLEHYPEFYKKAIPENGGPRIPGKTNERETYKMKLRTAVKSTLKSEEATGENYNAEQKELMIWYNYHFLGRSKPSTHIEVLAGMNSKEVEANLPAVFKELFRRIKSLVKA